MKILIAYDGTDRSDIAIEDLSRAGLPQDAQALILSVSASIKKSSKSSTKSSAPQRLRSMFTRWNIETGTSTGTVKPALMKAANAWQPDLVVLGSHSRSTLTRWVTGSVSSYMLHHVHRSVRVGRRSPNAGGQPLRLLIGIGGAQPSKIAVKVVAMRQWPPKTQVRLVGAIDAMLSQAGGVHQPEYNHLRDVITSAVDEAASLLRKAKLAVSSEICDALPAELILSEAQAWHADAIFVGSRNLGYMGRALMGSTSSTVFASAECSVEVVHGDS